MCFFNLYLPKQIDRGLESKIFPYLILYFWTILGFLGWQIGYFFHVIGYLLGVLGENIFIREKTPLLILRPPLWWLDCWRETTSRFT